MKESQEEGRACQLSWRDRSLAARLAAQTSLVLLKKRPWKLREADFCWVKFYRSGTVLDEAPWHRMWHFCDKLALPV